MSRRLVNRAGAPAAAGSSSRSGATTAVPEYEPPSCPLDDVGRRALGELSNNRGTATYQAQIKESVRYLGISVGDLHERLRAQRERLEHMRERREEKGTNKSPEEERLEAHVADLEARARGLTEKSEKAVRDLIDLRAELEDESATLADLYTQDATQNTNSNKHNSDADDDDGGDRSELPVINTFSLFRERRAEKAAAFAAMTMRERYALDNDYAAFKKLWHDAQAGEDGPPLPDAARWFRADGQPDMGRSGGVGRTSGARHGEEDESDEDIAVAREVLSINCPLTLRPMEEPFSNHKCKHTFERAAIQDYLSSGESRQCPQTGCSQTFTRTKFSEDFYLDQAMLRRIKRARQTEENYLMDVDDDDDEDQEVSVVAMREQTLGRGRGRPTKQEQE